MAEAQRQSRRPFRTLKRVGILHTEVYEDGVLVAAVVRGRFYRAPKGDSQKEERAS